MRRLLPRRPSIRAIVAAALLFLASCGPQPPDIDPDAGTDAGASQCPKGEKFCDGECIDPDVNREHCGTCGNSCSHSGLICVGGECECNIDSQTDCGNACYDLSSDPDHCGACNRSCGTNEKCVEGSCQTKTKVERAIEETNRIRRKGYDCDSRGDFGPAPEVTGNEELHEAAQKYAETMADKCFLSHTYPPPDCNADANEDCHDFAWRIRRTDYRGDPVGENIARGQDTAEDVVNGWAESDGHCANMLNPDAREMGIGYAESSCRIEPFWVQVFGR